MAKSLLQKMIDQGAMMVFRDVARDVLKSDAALAAKEKLRGLLGTQPAKKANKRTKDGEV